MRLKLSLLNNPIPQEFFRLCGQLTRCRAEIRTALSIGLRSYKIVLAWLITIHFKLTQVL
nr:MAG TPA: hypothetical protein [Caudoviricetes sp.]